MATPTPPLLPLASTGCGCCEPATPSATASAPASTRIGATFDGPISYQVTGMACGHCAAGVADVVSAVPRVDDVRIGLVAGGVSTVTVTGAASRQAVVDAIAAAGYSVIA